MSLPLSWCRLTSRYKVVPLSVHCLGHHVCFRKEYKREYLECDTASWSIGRLRYYNLKCKLIVVVAVLSRHHSSCSMQLRTASKVARRRPINISHLAEVRWKYSISCASNSLPASPRAPDFGQVQSLPLKLLHIVLAVHWVLLFLFSEGKVHMSTMFVQTFTRQTWLVPSVCAN